MEEFPEILLVLPEIGLQRIQTFVVAVLLLLSFLHLLTCGAWMGGGVVLRADERAIVGTKVLGGRSVPGLAEVSCRIADLSVFFCQTDIINRQRYFGQGERGKDWKVVESSAMGKLQCLRVKNIALPSVHSKGANAFSLIRAFSCCINRRVDHNIQVALSNVRLWAKEDSVLLNKVLWKSSQGNRSMGPIILRWVLQRCRSSYEDRMFSGVDGSNKYGRMMKWMHCWLVCLLA